MNTQLTSLPQRVPKELISRFVKICPTCQIRRGTARVTTPNSRRGSPSLKVSSRSSKFPSPPVTRRESAIAGPVSLEKTQMECFHQQNNWVEPGRKSHRHASLSIGPVRSISGGVLGQLPGPISANLNHFQNDIPMSSLQINYNTGYSCTQGPTHRDLSC